ncbi:acyltransferase [Bosea sp. UNC402CLCol]|uniref:acyltransferase family protein n=1 Tax=Bosea sp. UNC402CLCol TaxID=1510531 RepID=UPI00069113F0|nr:acyltransferase [Bosea sp. UNC402CLCol]
MFNVTVGRLRGLSILAVIALHYGQYLTLPFGVTIMGPAGNGYYGVTVFFVVSGFLITTNILKRNGALGAVALPDFYVRRAARILPLFLLFLVFLVAVSKSGVDGLAVPDDMSTLKMAWYALTFRFNVFVHWHEGYRVAAWLILWSLAIEEMFYLWYPLLCRGLAWRGLIVAALVSIIAYGPIYRATSSSLHFTPWDYFGCFDAIAMGAFVAIIFNRLQQFFTPVTRLLTRWGGATAMLLTYLFVSMQFHYAIGPFLMGVSAGLVIAASTFEPRRRLDPLSYLGRNSYELYLFHVSLIMIVRPLAPFVSAYPLVALAIYIAALIALSVLVRRYFSDPVHDRILDFAKSTKPGLLAKSGAS